ncbi:MAG: hypothetical protein KAG56_04855 [Sulfurovaceae bacterium]|nr:hypothetical protein [Sulfurovaceae bacterium]
MKLIKISTILASLVLTVSLSGAATLVELQGTKGQPDKELGAMIEKLNSIGYDAVGKNEHIEIHYNNKYKQKNLDLLNFYPVVDKESIRELLLANPDFGAYAPFNLLAYKKLEKDGGDTTWYGHLDADTMLNIIGEKDEGNKKKFKEMIAKLDTLVTDSMKPTESKKLTFDKPLPAEPLLKMVMKFDEPEDIEEYVEEFIMKHDSLFSKKEFIIAGFLDLKFEYGDLELEFEKYDAYWVSSLCHFGFSNSVFNDGDPQAGVFAPCSVYFYVPQGKNELHVGYATVDNWISSTGIDDEKKLELMREVSTNVEKALGELGFKKEVQDATTTPVKKEEKVVATETKVETPKAEPTKEVTKAVAEKKEEAPAPKQEEAKAPEAATSAVPADAESIETLKAELAKVKAEFEALKKKY